MTIRRVSFWAGPGAGKSTVAEGVSHALKKGGIKTELVQEYIKNWAYMKRVPQSFEQAFIFANQMHSEDFLLTRGVDVVVTDSPVLMNLSYSKRYGFLGWSHLLKIGELFEAKFPSVNILLSREGVDYQQNGRYETPAEAEWMDNFMREFMDEQGISYTVMQSVKVDEIVAFVKGEIGGNKAA